MVDDRRPFYVGEVRTDDSRTVPARQWPEPGPVAEYRNRDNARILSENPAVAWCVENAALVNALMSGEMVAVPREPTKGMVEAMRLKGGPDRDGYWDAPLVVETWRAGIDAILGEKS